MPTKSTLRRRAVPLPGSEGGDGECGVEGGAGGGGSGDGGGARGARTAAEPAAEVARALQREEHEHGGGERGDRPRQAAIAALEAVELRRRYGGVRRDGHRNARHGARRRRGVARRSPRTSRLRQGESAPRPSSRRESRRVVGAAAGDGVGEIRPRSMAARTSPHDARRHPRPVGWGRRRFDDARDRRPARRLACGATLRRRARVGARRRPPTTTPGRRPSLAPNHARFSKSPPVGLPPALPPGCPPPDLTRSTSSWRQAGTGEAPPPTMRTSHL